MNTRHNNMSRVPTVRNIRHNVPVTHSLDAIISLPSISPDLRTLCHVIRNEFMEACRRYVWNNRHAYSTRTAPPNFCCYCNNYFPFSASATDFYSHTSDISFIHFNGSSQLVPSRTYHGTTQFMKPSPRSIVTSKPENPLQAKSAGPMLLACHKPHGEKPSPKRLVCFMKQRSRSNGSLSFTFSAKKETTACQGWFIRNVPTSGATETSRPSKFGDIIKAGIVVAKPFIKLLECFRIIDAGNGVSWLLHNRILHHVVG